MAHVTSQETARKTRPDTGTMNWASTSAETIVRNPEILSTPAHSTPCDEDSWTWEETTDLSGQVPAVKQAHAEVEPRESKQGDQDGFCHQRHSCRAGAGSGHGSNCRAHLSDVHVRQRKVGQEQRVRLRANESS